MFHALRKLASLPPRQQRIALAAAVAMPLFWLALRAVPLNRIAAWLARPCEKLPRALDITATAATVNAVAVRIVGENQCLTRSLALQWVLRSNGVASQLRIGVRRVGSALEAHAWVERGGVPVNDSADVRTRYAEFPGFVRLSDFPA